MSLQTSREEKISLSSRMMTRSKSRIGRIDRISGLPDDVLLHILSLVSTRQAVNMSLLSKRWRHLWTCIPLLYFNETEFHELHHDKNTAFNNFTDQVLFLRREDEGIRKFHFRGNYVDGSHLVQWIIEVSRHRNVEELVIDIRGIRRVTDLPQCLSSCHSLRVLKLDVWLDCALKLPNDLNLSGLKSLHLKHITSEGGSLGKLISSCHYLEDLYLNSCRFDSLFISGNNLKKLSILSCGESKIKVSVRSLLSFVYSSSLHNHCSLDNLVSLVEAHIEMFSVLSLSENRVSICEILRGIYNASFLTLAYCTLRQELVECLPVFTNLIRLELDTRLNKDHVDVIINILERSPNLKTMILNKTGPLAPKQEYGNWTPKEISPRFLLHLEKIILKGFKSSALQLEFVNFLLSNTNSVKEIIIIP